MNRFITSGHPDLFYKVEPQLCDACNKPILELQAFFKHSTQSARNGKPIEVDIKIYHDACYEQTTK